MYVFMGEFGVVPGAMTDNRESITDVMLDLESFALGADAALLQIGCVPFNPNNRSIYHRAFLVDISPFSCLKYGGRIDPKTEGWWRSQGGFKPHGEQQDLSAALFSLRVWLSNFPNLRRVWAQGSQFDIAAIERYYMVMNTPPAWQYNIGRDTRTVYSLARANGWEKPKGTEPNHNAVYDCKVQIYCLFSALHHMGIELGEK